MHRCWISLLPPLSVALLGCELAAGLGDFVDAQPGGGTGGTAGAGAIGGGGTGGQGGGGSGYEPAALASFACGSDADELVGGVDTDTTGDIFLAGVHPGEITIHETHPNASGSNPFVASFDGNLATRWSKSFETSGEPKVWGLVTAGSGRTLIGGHLGTPINFGGSNLSPAGIDAFAARFSDLGEHEYSQVWGSAHTQQVFGVGLRPDGFVLAGAFADWIDFGDGVHNATDTDGYVVKFDNGGLVDWFVQLGGGNVQEVRAIAVPDNHDRLFVTGIFKGQIDVATPTGNAAIGHGGGDVWDAFVLALDLATGGLGPHQAWHDPQAGIVPRGIDLDAPTDSVVVAGSFVGTLDVGLGDPHVGLGQNDAFVVRFDLDLVPTWSVHYGAPNGQVAFDAAIDTVGNVVVVGHSDDAVDFGAGPRVADGKDAFMVKLSPTGDHLWSGLFGGQYDDEAVAVAIDSSDNIVVAGRFAETIDLGNGLLTSNGGRDLFLAKFPPGP